MSSRERSLGKRLRRKRAERSVGDSSDSSDDEMPEDAVRCPNQPPENYCDGQTPGDCTDNPTWCDCKEAKKLCAKNKNRRERSLGKRMRRSKRAERSVGDNDEIVQC